MVIKKFPKNRIGWAFLVASLFIAVAVAGCTTTATTPTMSATTTTTIGGANIAISNLVFNPSNITVSIGTTVTWTNQDNFDHTVTSTATSGGTTPDGRFNSGDLSSGEHWSFTFTQAGTYYYYCKHHTTMHGTIIVT